MKARLRAAIFFIVGLSSVAFGQQAKLEGSVSDDKGNRVAAVRIIAPGGQANETDSNGHFAIAFPAPVLPGQATRIEVGKPDWVIFEPLLGNCVTQSTARNFEPLQVIIVPKGSLLALSPKRLGQVIARWSNERVRLRSQVKEQQSQLDEYTFLREYAEKYGFTLEQFRAAADQWAKIQGLDDKGERALKEYWRKNYDSTYDLAIEAARGWDEESERSRKGALEADRQRIRYFRLAGNARYEQYKFREALAAYNEIETRFSTNDPVKKISKEDLPEEWAATKNSVGNAKSGLGEIVEGQESKLLLAEAVTDYREALKVYTRERLPQQWAMIQNNLGIALLSQGKRTSGPESRQLVIEAVTTFREALKVRTREQFPQDWAITQINLAVALHFQGGRMVGVERMRLLAEAVTAYRDALKVYTREQLPQQWAVTQSNLCASLRLQGEWVNGRARVQLLTEAVTACREALKIRTQDQSPQEWAMTQDNLGNALSLQGEDERADGAERMRLLAEAVTAYREALKVRTREQFPQEWADTQNNLGVTIYLQGEQTSSRKESERLLAEAIAAYREALKVRTRNDFERQWAETQYNLGRSLISQAQRTDDAERMQILTEAITTLREVLKVYTKENWPKGWADTQFNLAKAYFMLKNWKDAAISLQHILDLAPNDKYTYQNLASICHEQLFEYARAYTLHDQWLRRFPEDAAAQADFAETHFTTGRFAEFAARLKPLLANPELPAATKIALQMIEVANLLALDQSAQVPAALMALLETIAAQPADFRVTWSFNGTLHFIGTHEPLAARRDWLRQLITVLQADNRDVILTGLRAAQKQFSER